MLFYGNKAKISLRIYLNSKNKKSLIVLKKKGYTIGPMGNPTGLICEIIEFANSIDNSIEYAKWEYTFTHLIADGTKTIRDVIL